MTVTTTLELRAGERFLRVAHELDNRARDHRLRAHFPLPATVTGSDAECAFTVVHRGLTAEGGVHEARTPDLPVAAIRRRVRRHRRPRARARRPARVRSGRRRPRARAHAAALGRLPLPLRARAPPESRPARRCPVAGAQLPGRQRAEYAVLLHAGDWRSGRLLRGRRRVPRPVRTGARDGRRDARRGPRAASALRVDGAEVSAVLRSPGGLVVRVFRTDAERRAGRPSSTKARPPRVGSSTSRAARSRPSKAPSSSAPGRSAPSNSRNNPRTGVEQRSRRCRSVTPVRVAVVSGGVGRLLRARRSRGVGTCRRGRSRSRRARARGGCAARRR